VRLVNVVGARPNFMKIAPLMKAYAQYPDIEPILVHTGQHYDRVMSKLFFEELGLPKPDVNLGVSGGTHSEQTAHIMMAFETYCRETQPDRVLVLGDVNSTVACA
jgi:UDP-N-acetylglucosamine 2-epimerase (non-hydrolysing)